MLPGTSSVWEYLSFHARLRLPTDCGRERREARVWRVIQQLGLTKVCARCSGTCFAWAEPTSTGMSSIATIMFALRAGSFLPPDMSSLSCSDPDCETCNYAECLRLMVVKCICKLDLSLPL